MITSAANQQVKKIIQLNQKTKARRQEGLFVAEGKKMLREAPAEWIEKIYCSESALREDPSLAEGAPKEIVTDQVFRQMSDTCTPQGVLTLLKIPAYGVSALKPKEGSGLYLVLENLQDPGNLGTILRTAEAAGVNGILLTSDCVDLTNPKVVRGTMGAIYRVPWLVVRDVPEAKGLLRDWGVTCYAASLQGKNAYDEESYLGSAAFFIGNEGNGLTPEACACADVAIRIPMQGQTESLNAAMAAGILLYEAYRQRRRSE